MTINWELFQAILAMDAYNRGYNAGIDISENAVGQVLGNATITATSSTLLDENGNQNIDDDVSFYALAYSYDSNGDGIGDQTIISYRGTDNPNPTEFFDGDIWNGWSLGVGSSGSFYSKQAELAFSFYNAVSGGADPLETNISLTGHSLGGGLAGLVGGIYHQQANIYDSMGF